MKVATRVAATAGLVLTLLVLAVAFHVGLVQRLASANETLASVNFRTARIAVEQLRLLGQLEEFTEKAFATGGDPGYLARLAELREEFAAVLEVLRSLELSPEEQAAAYRVARTWRLYRGTVAPPSPEPPDPEPGETPAEPATPPEEELLLLGELGRQVEALLDGAELGIARQQRAAVELRRLTEGVSWTIVAAALAVSLPTLLWAVRSIRQPLRRLTEGTQAVSAGEFLYRLDESGNDELAEVAAGFNRMVRRLKELDRLKRDFLSHVSHELRTPLVAMRETNQLLLEEIPGPLGGRQKRMLELNQESTRRLSTMISRLLDLSRMEAGAMEYEMAPCGLAKLARGVTEEFEAMAAERRVTIELEAPGKGPTVRCDGDRVVQVLENLLSNALEVAPEGTRILVQVDRLDGGPGALGHGTRHPGGSARVRVRDRGPGVPEEHKELIFEKFHRAGPGRSGVGLGLAISKEIVEAHGGSIWVTDDEPHGSVFAFVLPLGGALPGGRNAEEPDVETDPDADGDSDHRTDGGGVRVAS